MPDREFIHSSADVGAVLQYLLELGFQIMVDEPQPTPVACVLTTEHATSTERGQFHVFRPEWVYGPFKVSPISGGYHRGKYDIAPRVNFAAISMYFHGERTDHGKRRFGSAAVSSYVDSLEFPANVVRPSPPDTDKWFKRIVGQLSSGVVVKAGVHKYHVTKGVLAEPDAATCLPPFDFIPWGTHVLYEGQSDRRLEVKRGKRRGKRDILL